MGINSSVLLLVKVKKMRKNLNKFKSKEIRKNNYFVLYDSEDNVMYFDNWDELSCFISHSLYDITQLLNRHNNNVINIIIDNQIYKLATYC